MTIDTVNLEALLDESIGGRHAKPCVIARTVTGLPEKYASALTALLEDPAVTSNAIAHRLAAAGLPGGQPAVARHRNGVCSCPKKGN